MNREILFRGKKVDGGEWIIGSLIDAKEKAYIIVSVETECSDGENTDLYATEWYEIRPDTICQYTGLTDKNGNKIFEGDIVRFGKNYGEVKFGLHESNWQIYKYNQGFFVKFPKVYFRNELGFWRDKVIVTGNIYDNPELLEKGKENGTD